MDFEQSFEWVLRQNGRELAYNFYRTVVARHPEIGAFFETVNLRDQASMLTAALIDLVGYHLFGQDDHREGLVELGRIHRDKMRVPPELFPKFIDTLMEMIEKFHGDAWNERLREEWDDALRSGVAVMLEGYKPELT